MSIYIKNFLQIKTKLLALKKTSCSIIVLSKIFKKYHVSHFKHTQQYTSPSNRFYSSVLSLAIVNARSDANDKNIPDLDEWKKEQIISHYIALAKKAITESDVDKAQIILGKALRVSDDPNTIGVTCVYELLATIAFNKGNAIEATSLLEEVIAKLSDSNNKGDKNIVVNLSLKLARLYENQGQMNIAELGFRNCVAIQKNKYLRGSHDEETTTLWVNSLFWYGKFLANQNRYDEAKQCFQSVYVLMPRVKTMGKEQAMVTLYNMGEMSFATGDNEGALHHLLNAVLLGQTLRSPDLPIYYHRIGLVYMYKGLYNEAKRWCVIGSKTSERYNNKVIKKESEECLQEIEKIISNKK